jgi:hypothetical protein
MNIVGSGAQTLTHATVLANLAKNSNKFGAVSQIFLSRFVTGPVFSNTTTTTARTESKPIQSKVDVGVLRVSNDRTHLEGIWHVDKCSIETGTLTTVAPKHTVSQKTESRGWSLSLNPAALLGAYLAPASLGLATKIGSSLPNVAFQESESTSDSTHHEQMNMQALFVKKQKGLR